MKKPIWEVGEVKSSDDMTDEEREVVFGKPIADALKEKEGDDGVTLTVTHVDMENKVITVK